MNKPYSQIRAMLSITRGSLRALFRNPSTVVFNIGFPLIFIIVFGFISGGGIGVTVGVRQSADTLNPVYQAMSKIQGIQVVRKDDNALEEDLKKGSLDAVVDITKNQSPNPPAYSVDLKTSSAAAERGRLFKVILEGIIDKSNLAMSDVKVPQLELKEENVEGRKYKTIDFILPGQLGFAILSTGVFGTAFVFINLRQTLVIKRFFATPINRLFIVTGEGLSRLIFSLMGSAVIVLIGHFAFGFTMINGFFTFINMLILSAIGLVVFLGFGFVVSGVAKNENSVPAIANIITLPQFLLAGTFFPISNFPPWLQPVSKILPLTYLNDALRRVAFEGVGLWGVGTDILVLLAWGVVIYLAAMKVFRWE